MSRPVKRVRASHAAVVAQAKDHPGEWVRVGAYRAGYTAKSIASQIRAGGGPHLSPVYAPAGSFDARTKLGEFDTEVYTRFRTGEAVS